MKKLTFILIVAIISIVSQAFADDTLHFVGLQNIIPFAYEEEGVKKGIDYEVFIEISKRMGFTAKIEFLPWKRIWEYLKKGSIDGTFQIYFNKKREEFIIYSKIPMRYSTINVFVNKGHEFDFRNISDLFGKTVGKQSGFFISPEFEQAVKRKKIILDEARDVDRNIKKLILKRIDCLVSNPNIVRFYMKKLGLQHEIVELPVPLVPEKKVHLALSKNGKNIKDKLPFMEEINKTIKEIHGDGTLQKISDKYLK
ncbi:MAG: transporter substrate-binding domain-containing protein [Deltaproteobacteria bacterium]|nr:transporter substrate-binding domain-containing protein [Deltaproteobacteria bacterium]